MKEIERRLRDLAERVREEQGPSAMPPNTMRAAKRRRLVTVLTGLLTVAALVSGVAYGAGIFDRTSRAIPPAREGTQETIELYAVFDDRRSAEIGLDEAAGTVCYMLSDFDDVDIVFIEIIAADGGQVALPTRSLGFGEEVPTHGWDVCRFLSDSKDVRAVSASPAEYQLSIQDGDGASWLATLSTEVEAPACRPPVDFEPTYLPEGWSRDLQRGTGGGGQAYPGLLGHYGEVEIGYYDLVIGAPFAQSNKSDIRVLGRRATSGDIHEGFSVEFNHDGCNYSLIAHVFDRSDLERFAEGLRFKERGEDPPSRQSFGAIWPEDSEERAGEECTSVQHVDGHWRSDAIRTAERFATDVLGWEEALATQSKREGGFSVYVGNGPISSDTPTVVVYVDELFGGCWSVISVSRLPEEQPKHDGSMLVRGRDVQMGFDLGDAVSATFEVGYGGQKTTYTWEGGQTGVEFRLDFEPRGTGHFLVLLRDENGEVFSAFGSPLPEGDFAAG